MEMQLAERKTEGVDQEPSAMSPFSVELILQRVFDYCDIKTVKDCTLIWNKEASEALRRNYWLNLKHVGKYGPEDKNKLAQLTQNADLSKFKYRKLKLILTDETLGKPQFRIFLRVYGENLKSLSIQLVAASFKESRSLSCFLHSILSEWCPNLVEFCLIIQINNDARPLNNGEEGEDLTNAVRISKPLKLRILQIAIGVYGRATLNLTFCQFFGNSLKQTTFRHLMAFFISVVAFSPRLESIFSADSLLMDTLDEGKSNLSRIRNMALNLEQRLCHRGNLNDFLPRLKFGNLRRLELRGRLLTDVPLVNLFGKCGETLRELTLHFDIHCQYGFEKYKDDPLRLSGLVIESPFFHITRLLPKLEEFIFINEVILRQDFVNLDDYFLNQKNEVEPHLNLKTLVIRNGSRGDSINDPETLEVLAKSFPSLERLELDINRHCSSRARNSLMGVQPSIRVEDSLNILSKMLKLDKAILKSGNWWLSFTFVITLDCFKLNKFREGVKVREEEVLAWVPYNAFPAPRRSSWCWA